MIEKLYLMQDELVNKIIEHIKANPSLAIQTLLGLIIIVVALAIGFSITGSSRR